MALWSWTASARVFEAIPRTPEALRACAERQGADLSCLQAARLVLPQVNQWQTATHPLSALLLRSPLRAWLSIAPHTDPIQLLRTWMLVAAATWAALLFTCLRMLRISVVDAAILSVVGLVSGAAVTGSATPGVAMVSSVTVCLAIAIVAWTERGRTWEHATTFVAAMALGCAVFNGGVAAAAATSAHHARRGLQIIANALFAVLVLWGIQRTIYSSSAFPLQFRDADGQAIARDSLPAGFAALGRFWVDPLTLSWHAGPIAMVALMAWIVLLGIGGYTLFNQESPRLRVFLAVSLGGQLLALLLVGQDAGTAALSTLPLLLVIAAMAMQTARRPALALALLLILAALAANTSR